MIIDKHIHKLKANDISKEQDLIDQKIRTVKDIMNGKYKFFERFKKYVVEMVDERKKKILEQRALMGPTRDEYVKNLLYNIGHYNSYTAIAKTRQIPT